MKHLLLLLYLLVPCSLAMGEAPVAKAKHISFNYMNLDFGWEKMVKGTMVALMVEKMEGYEIEGWGSDLFEEATFSLRLQNSEGGDLGELKDSRNLLSEEKKLFYYFTFPHLPTIGSEGLELSGKVPVKAFSCKTASKPQLLQIKNGSQLFLGDLTMTVGIPDKEKEGDQFDADFRFSSREVMKIIGMDFFDQDGKPLADSKGRPAYSCKSCMRLLGLSSTYESMNYSFERKPGVLNVVVNYWAKMEVLDLPATRKILFYNPEAEKTDGK